MFLWVLLNAIGLYSQRELDYYAVDHLAHLGGFAAGFLFGWALVLLRQATLEEVSA